MRSVALLALLAVGAYAITNQAYTAPTGDNKFGVDPAGTTDSSTFSMADLSYSNPSKQWTYTLGAGDQNRNIFFRTTFTNCSDPSVQAFTTKMEGLDGTQSITNSGKIGGTTGIHSGSSFVPDTNMNYANIINAGADSSAKAGGQTWTFTVALTTPPFGQGCQGFVDLISYGSVVSAGKIGANGIPGPTQDAWFPCCDAMDTVYTVAANDQPHKYLEASVQSQQGEFNFIKMHNPSLFSIDDITHFPSSGKGIVTVRTCLSNQSCEVKAQNYFVHIANQANLLMDEDSHATFTLTTKAGVASASAAIAMLVAALFALFH